MPPPIYHDEGVTSTALVLDQDRIVETIRKLQKRIDERFPESGLGQLCRKLHHIGEETKARLDEVERPYIWLRVATAGTTVILVAAVIVAVRAVFVGFPGDLGNVSERVQLIESAIQDIVFVGFAVWFLVTAEARVRRRRALTFIRELRAVAHIVDMHQLTKDPDRLLHKGSDTASSPVRTLTNMADLGRYLDYCSELLALTSKLAALYAERFSDAVVLQAVDEVESLTTGLSNKIWQKIMMLETEAVTG